MVAATDPFANTLQYAQDLRYTMHDPVARLDFDYSRRQANYRIVDLSSEQYRTKSMLLQFADGSGWFCPGQLTLIKAQNLPLPDLAKVREQTVRIKRPRSSQW